eukprot:gb/GECG01004587.1/.p1 GENE.gb/GECG01004587.1/~~gb/GECG01004587.1/.p1  ORF type:complete len:322 (+),score=62.98 gb/GECG01004587.1/:1-966(+)
MVVGKRNSSSSHRSEVNDDNDYEEANGTTTTPLHPSPSSSSQRQVNRGGTEEGEANPLRRRLSQNSSASFQSRKAHHYGYKPGKIERINVHNFKSYAGKQVIGPFHDFTAVIGPNGAGKSNLMDAISFVVGLSARHLRGSQLRDLVHRTARMRQSGTQKQNEEDNEDEDDEGEFLNAEEAKDSAVEDSESTAYVELVYQPDEGQDTEEDENEIRFKRVITPSGSTVYQVNDTTVTREAYDRKLESIGVLVKARNFLVFQGDVESLASKNPKKLLEHFEKISGSWELKNEYERLEKELADEQENLAFMYKRKKGFAEEKKTN